MFDAWGGPFLKHVQRTINRHNLLAPKGKVLAAVSGGADSVAMFYALYFLSRFYDLDLAIVHLNHQIREESGGDERFVRCLGWKLGIPVIVGRADIPRLAKNKGISLEMAGREARHAFFQRALRDERATMIATAHTADDQVETFFLRVARGASLSGLGGMPYANQIGPMRIIRPLRDIFHIEAVEFLRYHKLGWCEDITNNDRRFLRNRVRHELLPLLEARLNMQIRRVLLRTTDLLREENDWLEQLAAEICANCRNYDDTLAMDKLAKQPVAAQRRVLIRWLTDGGVSWAHLHSENLLRLQELVNKREGYRSLFLPDGWLVVRRYNRLELTKIAESCSPMSFACPLTVPGETILADQGVKVTTSWRWGIRRQTGHMPGTLPAFATLSAAALGENPQLRIRSWRAGDVFRPFGLAGSKKLQDIFVDAKVPRDARRQIPLVEANGQIIWVPGYRIAQGYEVPDKEAPSLLMEIESI